VLDRLGRDITNWREQGAHLVPVSMNVSAVQLERTRLRELMQQIRERVPEVTPQDVDLAALSAAAGVGHVRLERTSDLANVVGEARAAGGIRVIEVPTPAERSRRQRIDVRAAVDIALAGH